MILIFLLDNKSEIIMIKGVGRKLVEFGLYPFNHRKVSAIRGGDKYCLSDMSFYI